MIPALLAARAAPWLAGVIALAALVGYGTVQRHRATAAAAEAAQATAQADAYQRAAQALSGELARAAAATRRHAGTIATLRAAHDRDTDTLARTADDCLDARLPDGLRRVLDPGADAAAGAPADAPAAGPAPRG